MRLGQLDDKVCVAGVDIVVDDLHLDQGLFLPRLELEPTLCRLVVPLGDCRAILRLEIYPCGILRVAKSPYLQGDLLSVLQYGEFRDHELESADRRRRLLEADGHHLFGRARAPLRECLCQRRHLPALPAEHGVADADPVLRCPAVDLLPLPGRGEDPRHLLVRQMLPVLLADSGLGFLELLRSDIHEASGRLGHRPTEPALVASEGMEREQGEEQEGDHALPDFHHVRREDHQNDDQPQVGD
mmetsp:Transcript_73695/g.213502  ORF Transcript_73695/g.213502 Transcript_73695/m.213502 type:complete len:243 (+) Transcript_73695:795-1523(+)